MLSVQYRMCLTSTPHTPHSVSSLSGWLPCEAAVCPVPHAARDPPVPLGRLLRRTPDGFALRLRPADLAAIAALGAIRTGRAAAAQAASEDDLLCEAFSSKARVREGDAELPDFLAVKRPPEPGDDCPVCYCELVAGSGTLVGCPDCGNGLHAECARRWLAHSPAATCVYCRSTVWKKYRGRAP